MLEPEPPNPCQEPQHQGPRPKRRGAVGIILREERLLVIRRSQTVVAPGKFCFPGGGIEGAETEPAALIRELREELRVAAVPVRRLWQSVTPWGVDLAWWLAELEAGQDPVPEPSEVESIHWHTPHEMAQLEGLLDSNREFLAALARGEIELPL